VHSPTLAGERERERCCGDRALTGDRALSGDRSGDRTFIGERERIGERVRIGERERSYCRSRERSLGGGDRDRLRGGDLCR
jgi:hypothetical protein